MLPAYHSKVFLPPVRYAHLRTQREGRAISGFEYWFKVFLCDLGGLSERSERAREMMVSENLSRTKPQRRQERLESPIFIPNSKAMERGWRGNGRDKYLILNPSDWILVLNPCASDVARVPFKSIFTARLLRLLEAAEATERGKTRNRFFDFKDHFVIFVAWVSAANGREKQSCSKIHLAPRHEDARTSNPQIPITTQIPPEKIPSQVCCRREVGLKM
jgi:hypothetical protein